MAHLKLVTAMHEHEEDPVFGGINLLNKSLDDLDERGLVLSLAAFAEDALGQLLKAFLLTNEATNQLLEGFNAPLGTFSARIKAAYALGLIEKDQLDDLERLRKMRNEFAHSWRPIGFENAKISALIKALNYSSIDDKFPETLREKVQSSLSAVLIELRSSTNQIQVKDQRVKLKASRLFALIGGDVDRQIEQAEKQVVGLEEHLKSATGEKADFFKMLHERIDGRLYHVFARVPEDRKQEVLALRSRMRSMLNQQK